MGSVVFILVTRKIYMWREIKGLRCLLRLKPCSVEPCRATALPSGGCRRLEWQSFEVVLSGRKTINVRNVTNEAREKLEFRDRIIKISLCFQHLIVATSSQCYIYRWLLFGVLYKMYQLSVGYTVNKVLAEYFPYKLRYCSNEEVCQAVMCINAFSNPNTTTLVTF